jgi:hypothetical protein
MRAVIGTEVKDASGKRIGEIADLLLDERDRKILFAVVSGPDSGGIAEETQRVPWGSLRYDETAAVYLVTSADGAGCEPTLPIDELDFDRADCAKPGYWATG